jgi:hypothetical protein
MVSRRRRLDDGAAWRRMCRRIRTLGCVWGRDMRGATCGMFALPRGMLGGFRLRLLFLLFAEGREGTDQYYRSGDCHCLHGLRIMPLLFSRECEFEMGFAVWFYVIFVSWS